MKIKIVDIEKKEGKTIVTYESEYGSANAFWEGDSPQREKEYFVEIEVSGVLGWGDDIYQSEVEKTGIGEIIDTNTIFNGYLESVDEDGYTTIRIGDSILCVQTKGESCPIGTFVEIIADKVTIFDTDS